MARLRFGGRRQTRSHTVLLVALGAIAGLALGVVFADRTGGIEGLKAATRRGRRRPLVDDDGPSATTGDESDSADGTHEAHVDREYPVEHYEHALAGLDDGDLEARVLEVFRNDPMLRGRAIDIGAIGDGTIELTGWVHSADELAYALTLARGVPEVTEVMDSLAVRGADTRVGRSPTAG